MWMFIAWIGMKYSKTYYSWRSLTSCVCTTCGVYCAEIKPRWKNQCRNIPNIFWEKRTTSIIFWVVLFTIVSEKSCNLIPCIRAHTHIYVPCAAHTFLDCTREVLWYQNQEYCSLQYKMHHTCNRNIWNRVLHSRGISLFTRIVSFVNQFDLISSQRSLIAFYKNRF